MRRILVDAARRKRTAKARRRPSAGRAARRPGRTRGCGRTTARPGCGPHPAGRRGPGRRPGGRAAPLRRAVDRGCGRRPRPVPGHRLPPLDVRPGLAPRRHLRGRVGLTELFSDSVRQPASVLALVGEPEPGVPMPTDPNRVKEIFLAAAELPDAAARAAYLDRACGGDAGLRAGSRRCSAPTTRPAASSARPRPWSPTRTTPTTRGPSLRPGGAAPTPRPGRRADDLEFLAPPSRPDSLGRIGHYEVLEVLGKGGLRHRLSGLRRRAAAGGRGQGAGPAAGRHVARPQAVPARGPVVGPGPARERRAGLRGRGAAAAVPGDGVHPRRDAPAAARPDRPARRAGGAADRPADRRGAGRRPRDRPDPPRHQAGQHPARRRASSR